MVKKISLVNVSVLLVLSLGVIACSKPLHKNKFVAAGTYLEVTSIDPRAAEIVYQEFKRLSSIFNAYDDSSEISRLNRSYNSPVKVSRDLFEILELSREITDLTQNSFDLSCGILYKFWKRLIDKQSIIALPSKELIEKVREFGGIDTIKLDSDNKTVTITKKGVVLDLGAIAKGFMVDKAVARLKKQGIEDALINAGGDMYCLGTNRGKPWKVGIKDPKKLGFFIETKELSNQAIATSGSYEQFFRLEGEEYSHLIDPRSGYPITNNIRSVSVIADRAAVADALATAFFVMGRDRIKKFLAKSSLGVKILVVEKGGVLTRYE